MKPSVYPQLLQAEGARVVPFSFGAQEPDWVFGLDLVAWGRGEELMAVGPGELEVTGTLAEYRRAELTEWYVNSESRLEQAFASGNVGGFPQPYLSTYGADVHCQWWGRDTPGNSYLSDGLQYTVNL